VTRLDKPGFPPLLSTTKHKINGTQPPQPFLSVIYVSGTQIYLGTKVEEASHLVPTELGKGVESLLEQDSEPNHLVVPFTPICVNPSYWQQGGAKASGFKEAIARSEEKMAGRRESRRILSSVRSRQALDISRLSTNSFSVIAAAHCPVKSHPSPQANSFHRK
jgi:hypothetical protein